MKKISLSNRAIIAGLSTALMMFFMILMGFEMFPGLFHDEWVEIGIMSILFLVSILLICYGIALKLDDHMFGDGKKSFERSKRPSSF